MFLKEVHLLARLQRCQGRRETLGGRRIQAGESRGVGMVTFRRATAALAAMVVMVMVRVMIVVVVVVSRRTVVMMIVVRTGFG